MRFSPIVVVLLAPFIPYEVSSGQIIKPRVLAEGDSLKVIGAEGFPKNLECEIYVGPQPSAYFGTKGANGRIDMASIYSARPTGPVISLVRRDTERESYFLQLFTEDADGKVLSLFDLNLDGVWDVKKTTKEGQRNLIFLRNQWIEVDKIDRLHAAKPKATKGEEQFEFDEEWRPTRVAPTS